MPPLPVHRIEVRPTPEAGDPKGVAAHQTAVATGITPLPTCIDVTGVYLIEGALTDEQVAEIATNLLADPITETAVIGAAPPRASAVTEVHPLPGVMDPAADAIQEAIESLIGVATTVQTGVRYDHHGVTTDHASEVTRRCFANELIHAIYAAPFHPESFPTGHVHDMTVSTVKLRGLDDQDLATLSRRTHLFLSVEEMRAIQSVYDAEGRDPSEIELETLAQTWSEHCVHKTLKATIRYDGPLPPGDRPGHEPHEDGTTTIHNLLKSTVAAATFELMDDGASWCLSVFVDNAGIVAFDDDHAVCFKVETHNHPSALEPYGGAATGIGGCIRDIMGTGLAAKPIAATDVFCVAQLDSGAGASPPSGCLPARRILSRVVAGVRDYGNRMGIPTLNGAVWFDDRYVGNPLVYCGCIGVMPRDRVTGDPEPGDHIIVLGGRTGRDGIHGATFSSAELTDSHVEEFSHAVQIGNPITEKKTLDAILEAQATPAADGGCLYSSITDCGAGGFSSAVGEMAEELGATVHLDRAPLKYAGLTPTEIWISEAQERMVLAVPQKNIATLIEICATHDVDLCDLGTFGTTDRTLELFHDGTQVGTLSMALLHEGLPSTTRHATWVPPEVPAGTDDDNIDAAAILTALLSHPNIASKASIIRQYDHEVQGRSVVGPLVGLGGRGPSDGAVITPVEGSTRGLAIANGLATGLCSDPYLMALAAIDECVRNLICTGADPTRIAILDNFCWPSCDEPEHLGSLVRAAHGCYDGAKAYQTPFISGKDSLHNQFTTEDGQTIRIPPTLLISGFSIVDDIHNAITMDAKVAGSHLLIVGETSGAMGGSHLSMIAPESVANWALPEVDLKIGPAIALAVAAAIATRGVRSAHDCSEGGILLGVAEMAFAGGLGVELNLAATPTSGTCTVTQRCFSETPSRYLLEVAPEDLEVVTAQLSDVPWAVIGTFNDSSVLLAQDAGVEITIETLSEAWSKGVVV